MNPALVLLFNVVVIASVPFVISMMLILLFERVILRDEPGRAGGEEGRGDPRQDRVQG